jgi:CBS domain-containing protein
MSLLKIASVPPAAVAPSATVLEAVEIMAEHSVGAVAVVDNDQLLGIFTERDLMFRVVLRHRHPKDTRVGEVMTTPAETITDESREEDALVHMVERHVRHLPIVDAKGKLTGMLSIRNLLEHRVDELARELHSLDQYLSNDGPGG